MLPYLEKKYIKKKNDEKKWNNENQRKNLFKL